MYNKKKMRKVPSDWGKQSVKKDLRTSFQTNFCKWIIWLYNFSFGEASLYAACTTYGWTIRKVMGGRGIFEPQEFVFVIKFLV